MHERVTGLRDNSSFFLAGVDRTQGIALDELFGKKVVDQNGQQRLTKTYRKTRVTHATIKEGSETTGGGGTETSKKISEVEMKLTTKMMTNELGEEDDEIVVVPT